MFGKRQRFLPECTACTHGGCAGCEDAIQEMERRGLRPLRGDDMETLKGMDGVVEISRVVKGKEKGTRR